MPDIDLEPKHYRVKGRSVLRYVSSRPFKLAAVLAGVWAVLAYKFAGYVLPTGLYWTILPIAFLPGGVLFVTSLLFLHEGTVEPPVIPRVRPSRRPSPARRPRPQDQQWKMYRED